MKINPVTNDQNEESSVFNSNGKDSTEDFGELSIFKWTVGFWNTYVEFYKWAEIWIWSKTHLGFRRCCSSSQRWLNVAWCAAEVDGSTNAVDDKNASEN